MISQGDSTMPDPTKDNTPDFGLICLNILRKSFEIEEDGPTLIRAFMYNFCHGSIAANIEKEDAIQQASEAWDFIEKILKTTNELSHGE